MFQKISICNKIPFVTFFYEIFFFHGKKQSRSIPSHSCAIASGKFNNDLFTKRSCYRPQTKLRKEMCSQACVKNSVHGRGSLPDNPLDRLGRHPPGRHPREDTPEQTPPGRHPLDRTPLRRLLQRTVRILLECILVLEYLFMFHFKSKRSLVVSELFTQYTCNGLCTLHEASNYGKY